LKPDLASGASPGEDPLGREEVRQLGLREISFAVKDVADRHGLGPLALAELFADGLAQLKRGDISPVNRHLTNEAIGRRFRQSPALFRKGLRQLILGEDAPSQEEIPQGWGVQLGLLFLKAPVDLGRIGQPQFDGDGAEKNLIVCSARRCQAILWRLQGS
jgi:hypothetical protein